MSKNLKQQIRETILNQNYPIENLEELEDDILKTIKNWLQQKRHECLYPPELKGEIYAEELEMHLQTDLIDKFLKEIDNLFGDNK